MQVESRFRTLVDILDHSVATYRESDLFGTKKGGQWVWTTYGEFGTLVQRFRGGLASLGIQPGDCVGIVSNNRVEWAVAAYACFSLGAAYVPMYEAQDPKDWDFIVRDCEAKLLLVANEQVLAKAEGMLGSAPSLRHIVVIDCLIDGNAAASSAGKAESGLLAVNGDPRITTYGALLASGKRADPIKPAPEDTAGLIYTSGTTGIPKGVILTHSNIASNVGAINEILSSLDNADRSLSFLPWAHSFGQTGELHLPFSMGASMAICESVEKILDNLAEVKPSVLFSVPRIFSKLYTAVQLQLASKPRPVQSLVKIALKISAKERAGERLGVHERALRRLVDKIVFQKVRARFGGRLKFAVSGGAALSPAVAEFIDSIGITVYEGYGLTETSPIVSVNVPGARKVGSVGRPIPRVRVEIDPATAEAKAAEAGRPERVEGEIVVYGPNVMKGYLKRPEDNSAVFTRGGGFRTGDMGYLDSEGYLFITGRIKEQYKLENGKYVVPTPLEEQLKLSPFIANIMVYGDNKPYNVALVVANLQALNKWAADQSLTLPSDSRALLEDERVRSLFEREIEKSGSAFKGYEAIRDFALIASDFTTDNGMLTPKQSLKRRKVLEAYGSEIEQLYAKKRREKTAGTSVRSIAT